ncbi:predicted protein [Histoplasma capsulatum H143]|uniref:Uncharacterized protein n=1 Tax=Ajellomyces capsulatus (strain H143) TaxID=544712 RepID=C6HBJ1_AJECH|nr:predicted protein [Histoplasma capsulatum H143]
MLQVTSEQIKEYHCRGVIGVKELHFFIHSTPAFYVLKKDKCPSSIKRCKHISNNPEARVAVASRVVGATRVPSRVRPCAHAPGCLTRPPPACVDEVPFCPEVPGSNCRDTSPVALAPAASTTSTPRPRRLPLNQRAFFLAAMASSVLGKRLRHDNCSTASSLRSSKRRAQAPPQPRIHEEETNDGDGDDELSISHSTGRRSRHGRRSLSTTAKPRTIPFRNVPSKHTVPDKTVDESISPPNTAIVVGRS